MLHYDSSPQDCRQSRVRCSVSAVMTRAMFIRRQGDRKQYGKGGSLSGDTCNTYLAAHRGDHTLHVGQTEAGSLARFFGSEKWIKNLLLQIRGNASAGVCNRKKDMRGFRIIRGRIGDNASFGHGIKRIKREIEYNLPQLLFIRIETGHAAVKI